MFEDDEFDYIFICDIGVKEWNSMLPEQQEEYITTNNIKVCYTHDISDTLSRGFGRLDRWGFWEYQCKQIERNEYKYGIL